MKSTRILMLIGCVIFLIWLGGAITYVYPDENDIILNNDEVYPRYKCSIDFNITRDDMIQRYIKFKEYKTLDMKIEDSYQVKNIFNIHE